MFELLLNAATRKKKKIRKSRKSFETNLKEMKTFVNLLNIGKVEKFLRADKKNKEKLLVFYLEKLFNFSDFV